jgi:hypothetical protein
MEPGTSPVRSEFYPLYKNVARTERKMRWRLPGQCSVYIFQNVVKNHKKRGWSKASWFIFSELKSGWGIRPHKNLKHETFLNYVLHNGYTEQHRAVVKLQTGKVGQVRDYAISTQILQANDVVYSWNRPLSHPHKSPMFISHIIRPCITYAVDFF